MKYKTHEEFFADLGDSEIQAFDNTAETGIYYLNLVTVEELYQHIKARLLSEFFTLENMTAEASYEDYGTTS